MDTVESQPKRGPGRKKLPDDEKKHPITLKLPGWLLGWLENHKEETHTSRAVLIEQALIKTFKIKRG